MAGLLTMHSFIEAHKRMQDYEPLQQDTSWERMGVHMLAGNALNFLRKSITANDSGIKAVTIE